MATTAIVCDVATDKAVGSDVGVDDHSIKLPVTEESPVWTCAVSKCLEVAWVVLGAGGVGVGVVAVSGVGGCVVVTFLVSAMV